MVSGNIWLYPVLFNIAGERRLCFYDILTISY